jgi:hypothetical protein
MLVLDAERSFSDELGCIDDECEDSVKWGMRDYINQFINHSDNELYLAYVLVALSAAKDP